MKNSDAIKNLMQLAIFSQSKGILDLDVAIVVKESIDSLKELVDKLEKEEEKNLKKLAKEIEKKTIKKGY